MNKNYIKSSETDEKLKKSLLKLLSTSKIDEISIKEIAYDTNINRSTFYLHYKDITELLEEVENDMVTEVRQMLNKLDELNLNDPKNIVSTISEYLSSKKEVIRILLLSDPGFQKKIKDSIREGYTRIIKNNNGTDSQPQIELAVSANFGVLKDWLLNNIELDINEYGDFVLDQTNRILKKQ